MTKQGMTIITGLIILFLGMNANAQLTIDGEYRTRFVSDHGFKVPVKEEADAAFSFDQRTRLQLNYTSEKYSARLTLQDARIWGSDDMYNPTGLTGNSNALDLFEAWVDVHLRENSSLRIGRQIWNYGDMRILSQRNWWTSGHSYDGLLYKMHDAENGLFVDAGISYNNNGSRTGVVDNSSWSGMKLKTMNFLNIRKVFNEQLSATVLATLAGKEEPESGDVLGTGTHGLYLRYNEGSVKRDGLWGHVSAYYQHGTDTERLDNGSYKDISAYMIASEMGVRTMERDLELGVGFELMSGEDYSEEGADYHETRHSFDLLYGSRFIYYGGKMNHFVVQDSYKTGTKGGGYFNPYFTMGYQATSKTKLNAAVCFPSLTTDLTAHTGIAHDSGKPVGVETDENGDPVYWSGSLGTYMDLGMTHKISDDMKVKSGFSFGKPSGLKNQMVYGYENASDQKLYDLGTNYFGWIMLVVKPGFL